MDFLNKNKQIKGKAGQSALLFFDLNACSGNYETFSNLNKFGAKQLQLILLFAHQYLNSDQFL